MGRALGTASPKSWKFNPSKRISPLSVPIHRYPSADWAIAETDPPGNPLSLPHWSRMYWDIARSGSTAWAGTAEHTRATPIRNRWASHRLPKPPLRAVFKFLNNNLILVLRGIVLAGNDEEREFNHL